MGFKMNKKTDIEKWKEMTHGAWWLPFYSSKEIYIRKNRNTLFACDKCDKVYSIVRATKPNTLYYYSALPKCQIKKTCAKCEGKKILIIET